MAALGHRVDVRPYGDLPSFFRKRPDYFPYLALLMVKLSVDYAQTARTVHNVDFVLIGARLYTVPSLPRDPYRSGRYQFLNALLLTAGMVAVPRYPY